MTDELERLRKKENKRLNKHDQYLAALGSANDASFNTYANEEIARHERMKAREQVQVNEASEYSGMSSAEFNAAVADVPDDRYAPIAGAGTRLTLDEAMTAERKRRGDE